MQPFYRSSLKAYALLTALSVLISFIYVDLPLAEYFHSRRGDSLWHFFDWLTEFGEGIYWILPPWVIYLAYRYVPAYTSVFNFLLRKDGHHHRMYMAAFVGLTAFWSGLIVNVLKLIFARYRPVEFFEHGNFGISWFDYGYRMASFPSGHSATAISVAVAFVLLYPRYALPSILIGLMVLFSRVVLAEHYLSDTLMGGFIGVMSSLYLYQRYYRRHMALVSQ